MPAERSAAPRFEEIRPEPTRFWVRWAPRGWRGPRARFVDLARGRLAPRAFRRGEPPAAPPAGPPDTLYLPPVRPEDEEWRGEWMTRARAAGHPPLAQVIAGEPAPAGAEAVVFDLTEALLAGDLDRLAALPAGSTAVWPLVAGLTDDRDLMRRQCAALSAAGVATVRGVLPELTSAERRGLAEEGGEKVFEALFHRPAPSLASLVQVVIENGMSPWMTRPELAGGGRRARNRSLAAHLATLAEGALLRRRPEGEAQALFRAARWVDGEDRDVAAIAAEGNLAIVDWLESACRSQIERFAAGGGEEALAELRRALVAFR